MHNMCAGDVLGSTIVGTYGFMAPEQFTGQAVPASDLYALGSTLLFMVSGLAPGQFTQTRMKLDWRCVRHHMHDASDTICMMRQQGTACLAWLCHTLCFRLC
jgi:serine/threonine protein kinase